MLVFLRSSCDRKMLVELINVSFCVRHHYMCKIHIIKVYVVHFEIRFYHVMVKNRKIQCTLSSTIGIKEETVSCWLFKLFKPVVI